jgi:hypothetical protein
MLEAALLPRKLSPHYLVSLPLFYFMSDQEPDTKPDPECIPVPDLVPLSQKVPVPEVPVPQHCIKNKK